jgi:hypothetical protein
LRLRKINLLFLLVLLPAGCGGEGASNETAPPALSPVVATRLASASDAVADALDSGDVCTAARLADDLSDAVDQAIAAGEVPAAFRDALTSRADALVNEVNCPPPPPPPPPTTTEEENEDHGKGKAKGHEKKDKGTVTVPTDTSTETFTDTTDGG